MPTTLRQPLPTGGLVTATPSDLLDKDKSPQLKNVRFRFGAVYPMPGREYLGSAVDDVPLTIARFSVDDQTKWMVMLTNSGMWKWGDLVPGTPAAWVKVAGPTLPGVGRWSWTTGEDYFFFARDGSNGIWRWGGSGAYENLHSLTATQEQPAPEQVRFVEYFNNRLLAGSVVDVGERWSNRVRWPINGDHTDWTGDGSGFLDFYEPEQEPLQGLRVLGNRCVVLREHSLVDMVATGTLAPVFVTEQRTVNVGTMFPFTIASNGLALFFLGNDGNVWAWNGSNLTPVGNPIQNLLENIVDIARSQDYCGIVYPFRNEYWMWMGGSDMFVLDLLQGRWMRDDVTNFSAIGDAQLAQIQPTWNDIVGVWNQQTMTWAQLRRGYDMRVVIGRTDKTTVSAGEAITGLEDERAFSCEIQTADLYFQPEAGPNAINTVLKTLLVYNYNNDVEPFEISISGDRGRTWQVQFHIPNRFGYGICSWKVTSNVIRFRFRSNGSFPVFKWTHMVIEFVQGGPYTGLDQNG